MHRFIFQRYWLYIVPVVLLAVPLYVIRARHSLEGQLPYHREFWLASRMPHYSYTFKEYPQGTQASVEVQHGKLIKYTQQEGRARDFTLRPFPIESIFSSIAKDIGDSRQGKLLTLHVQYDATHGYPVMITEDYPCTSSQCGSADGVGSRVTIRSSSGYNISNFKILP